MIGAVLQGSGGNVLAALPGWSLQYMRAFFVSSATLHKDDRADSSVAIRSKEGHLHAYIEGADQ